MFQTTMNLANVVDCPYKAGPTAVVKAWNVNSFCPGWNQSPYDPPSNMPDGFYNDPDALPEGTAIKDCPVVKASCDKKPSIFWFKPEGDVYRMFGQEMTYPVQGLAMYDTWMPTMMENNVFYDYPGLDAYRHAIGSHLSNEFQMSIKNLYLRLAFHFIHPILSLSSGFHRLPAVTKVSGKHKTEIILSTMSIELSKWQLLDRKSTPW